jgi:RNA polymerase sigma-70 factor (ECF subfamily)
MKAVYELQGSLWLYIMSIVNRLYFKFYTLFASDNSQVIEDTKEATSSLSKAQINIQAERLLHDYGNSILRLAYSYLRNMSDAEDVLQETLIQFIKTSPVFETKSHEKAWLLRVAINISKNRLQYNKIRNTDELSENLTEADKEDLAFVWEAVKELPDKYREVIHLFYQEGFFTTQIAEMLGKNETTVRSLLHRGRIKLKEILKEVYDFEE